MNQNLKDKIVIWFVRIAMIAMMVVIFYIVSTQVYDPNQPPTNITNNLIANM